MRVHFIELRQRKKLSLRKLSELTGLSKTGLHEIELGSREPKQQELEKIAEALDTTVDELN